MPRGDAAGDLDCEGKMYGGTISQFSARHRRLDEEQ